jgi:beta-1,4-mannosyltransferase
VLLITGRPHDPDLEERLRRAAKKDSRIRLRLEVLCEADLIDVVHAADCVLLPYARITGSGALLLALTAGRGVVCSDLPFFRETLEPEPDAGVLASTQPPAFAAGIQEFFAMPAEVRQRAALRLADRYDWARVVAPVASWLTHPEGHARLGF